MRLLVITSLLILTACGSEIKPLCSVDSSGQNSCQLRQSNGTYANYSCGSQTVLSKDDLSKCTKVGLLSCELDQSEDTHNMTKCVAR
jgi:hypothetical protein